MAKYDPLRQYLEHQTKAEVLLTFAEIETVLNTPLPPSARKHSAWWANELIGNHVQKHAWFNAGFRVANIDLLKEQVVFRRS